MLTYTANGGAAAHGQDAPAAGSAEQKDRFGIPNLTAALEEALRPFEHLETEWTFDDMVSNIGKKIQKASNKFWHDERLNQRGSASEGKAVIEDFIENVMSAVNSACYDRVWFQKADFTGALIAASHHTFTAQKIFARTLRPMIEKHVQEAMFRWAEEERIGRCIWDAVEASGVKESHKKKARTHIASAYDEAHMKGPWGTLTADTTEMSMLQEFVKGWMSHFVRRAWDILQHGLSEGQASRDQQILFTTVLFQNLTAADNACLPHDLTSIIEAPPSNPWPFIAEASESVFRELDAYVAEKEINQKEREQNQPAKWAKKGGGKGGWEGGGKGGGGGGWYGKSHRYEPYSHEKTPRPDESTLQGPFEGVVKRLTDASSSSTGHSYGFVHCEETINIYGRDVFLNDIQVVDVQVGSRVRFQVALNLRGMPQAHNLEVLPGEGELM